MSSEQLRLIRQLAKSPTAPELVNPCPITWSVSIPSVEMYHSSEWDCFQEKHLVTSLNDSYQVARPNDVDADIAGSPMPNASCYGRARLADSCSHSPEHGIAV